MMSIDQWPRLFLDLLGTDDEEACASILASFGGSMRALVALPEADLTVVEALRYASVLRDLGNVPGAMELAREALRASLAVPAAA